MTSYACFRAVSDVRAATSLQLLHDMMSKFTRDFGFDNFAIVKRDPSNLYADPAILTNFPSANEPHECAFGPGTYALIEHAESSLTPFWWSRQARLLEDGQSAKIFNPELSSAQLGLIIPVPDSNDVGGGGFVAFTIEEDTDQAIALPPYSMQIGFHAFHQASALWRVANETPQLTNMQHNLIVHLAHGRPTSLIALLQDRKPKQISSDINSLLQRYRVSTREQIVMHALKERAVKLNELIAS